LLHDNKQITDEDIYLTISKNIKKYRIINRMTQKDLAIKTGYSYAYIRRLEGPGCIKNFSIQTIYILSKALNIEIKHFFENDNI